MNNLLLILGVVIILIGAIVIWRLKYRHRRANMAKPKRQEHQQEDEKTKDSYFDDPLPQSHTDGDIALLDSVDEHEIGKSIHEAISWEENPPDTVKNEPPPPKSELIIALYVVSPRESGFMGTDIFLVLEELGLKYGDMGIFHHYGIGDIKAQQAIFSVANMLEPGTFEPQRMSEFVSPGLALFMRLPGPFGGRVAFELMLNNAQRMADMLEGWLIDAAHTQLDQKAISALRTKIANFEQRSTNLSMLKRFS